jgi:hypothetical protein
MPVGAEEPGKMPNETSKNQNSTIINRQSSIES